MDSHSSCRPVKAKTRRSGFYEEVKLTDKPLSFGYSVVDSHSSCRPVKAKTRRSGFYEEVKLTDKPGSVVDSHSSRPAIAHWLKQPTRVQYGPYLMNPYLALLRVEFTVPRTVTSRAVRSYRTLSPYLIPLTWAIGGLLSVALVVGFPRRYLAPCPMELGLSSPPPVSPKGRRRSGDCLVSFGAQYSGFARLCHPALRIPIARAAATFLDAR
ncbi:hypothetical protein RB531_1874 [Salmonella enterica subsp. enterica serovar Typhimurium]